MPATIGTVLQGVATGGGIVTGAAQAIIGAHRLKKDKEELSKLHQPFYKIQDEYFQNRNMANEMAQGGLTAQAKNLYVSESQRGLGAGISALGNNGGGPSDVSKLFDVYNRSISNVAASDAEAHINNMRYYMNTQKDLAGQKTMKWSLDEYQPYQAKLKELTQRRAADEQMIWGGADKALGSVSAQGSSMMNQDLMSKLFAGMQEPYAGPSAGRTGYVDPSMQMPSQQYQPIPNIQAPNIIANNQNPNMGSWRFENPNRFNTVQ